jgi:hypothetical protein
LVLQDKVSAIFGLQALLPAANDDYVTAGCSFSTRDGGGLLLRALYGSTASTSFRGAVLMRMMRVLIIYMPLASLGVQGQGGKVR